MWNNYTSFFIQSHWLHRSVCFSSSSLAVLPSLGRRRLVQCLGPALRAHQAFAVMESARSIKTSWILWALKFCVSGKHPMPDLGAHKTQQQNEVRNNQKFCWWVCDSFDSFIGKIQRNHVLYKGRYDTSKSCLFWYSYTSKQRFTSRLGLRGFLFVRLCSRATDMVHIRTSIGDNEQGESLELLTTA